MNEEAMRKHYEKTPKETLIKILVASRKEVEKLQNRNKERKQEIERLNNIIEEAIEYIVHPTFTGKHSTNEEVLVDILRILKGSESNE